MVVISMALSAFAIWHTSDSYADDMYTTTLVHVGAREPVNWDLEGSSGWETYSLGTPVNRLDSYGYGPYWAILKTEFEKCGTLTKISLSKEDGTELDFIEAADESVGLQSNDLEAHKANNGDPLYGLDESHDFPSMSQQHDSYWLSGIAGYDGMPYRGRDYVEVYGPFQRNKDKYNQVITFYFDGAEDIPAIPPEVQAVIDAINAIDDPVTLESEDAIATAREEYDKLSEEYKAKIDEDTLKKLTDAERTLKEIKAKPVKEAIAALPKASELTLNDKAAVEAARVAYDALSSEAKEYVDNITTLELAEATIAKLEAQAELAQAKEKLNEALENAEPEDDIDKLAEQVSQAKEALEKAEQELKNLKDEKAAAKLTVSGLKVTSKIKKFTVTWKKNAKADGYQVQYKLKSAKKFSTLKTLAKTKVVSKKLKKGKMYQFKVRTYKTVNGTKVYGKWSPIKTCKCK